MKKDVTVYIISNTNKVLLQIYDSNNNKIIEKYINNKYIFNGEINKAYKIKIISNDNTLITSIYISNKYNCPYILDVRKKCHHIFIKLLDRSYPNLKIQKGEIKFWQSNIT